MATTGERRRVLQASAVCSQLFISALIALALFRSQTHADAAAPPPYGFDFQHRQPSPLYHGSSALGSSNLPAAPGSSNLPAAPISSSLPAAPISSSLPGVPGSSSLPGVPGSGNVPGVLGSSNLPVAPSQQGGYVPSPAHYPSSDAPPAATGLTSHFPTLLSNPFSAAQAPRGVFAGVPAAAPSPSPHQPAHAEEIKKPLTLSSLNTGRAGVVSSVFGGAPPVDPQQQQAALPSAATQGQPNAISVAATTESSIAALAKEARLPPDGRRSTRSGRRRNYIRKSQEERLPTERPQRFSAWAGAQPNNVLVIALADTTLFQGICVGSGGRSDPRVPCGMAYPGASTFAVHLALGPTSLAHASKAPEETEEVPPLPAVLLTTAGSAGVEDAPGFADDLLYRAWVAKASGGCAANYSAFEWGAGPTDFFTRSNATEATSKSRKSRTRSFKRRGEMLAEFMFRCGSALHVCMLSVVYLSPINQIKAEQSAVNNAIGIRLREVVDRYLSLAFEDKSLPAERRLSPELPLFFIKVQQIRLVRDPSAAEPRVVAVELARAQRNPMDNLGTPVVFYTTAVGAAYQAYVLGHVKSAGLRDIVRQTILDARSVGPLHQPALAGYVAALREDVSRLHAWLVGLGPSQSITQSVGKLSALLLKSQIAAFDLQGTCNAAVTLLALPEEDPMLRFARQYCRVYPQTHFLQLAGSEELEAYSLQWGLVAYELLGGADALIEESDRLGSFSLAADDNILEPSKHRRLASDDSQDGEEDSIFPHSDDLTPMSEAFLGSQRSLEGEEEQGRDSPASEVEAAGDGESIFSSPSVSPVSEDPQDSGSDAGAVEAGAGEANSENFLGKSDASSLGADATADAANVQKTAESEDKRGADAADTPQITAERLVIERLQQELENQKLQQQLLLQHLAAQQEQQRLIQRQQEELFNLRQQQQQQKPTSVEQPQLTSKGEAKDQDFERASPPAAAPGEWYASQPTRVTFPGINIFDEEHLSVRDSVEAKIAEKRTHRAADVAEEDRRPEAMWISLQERYGPLFMNFVATLLSGNTLEDLIQVAEWHLDPRGNSRLCRHKRFSLFSYARRLGRFSLMRRIMGHRKHFQEIVTYMDEGDMQTWRRALEGLKRFQAFFD
ncbi:hypothetical protein Emed_006130 [Eimeria media]